MKKPTKIILALATLWPIAYGIFFLFYPFFMLFGPSIPPGKMPLPIWLLFPLSLLTMVVTLVLAGIYLVNIFRNPRVPKENQALWAVAVFLGGPPAQIIYWYLYLWREPFQTV